MKSEYYGTPRKPAGGRTKTIRVRSHRLLSRKPGSCPFLESSSYSYIMSISFAYPRPEYPAA